ncbi:MAG: right-handed parallel beta-helix repeat-containing protein [Candidatus Lokiarchaeota archaeon]|nr:right-handed parallel beta-helix repeat-containing protein [Candidatus Lokiarchaeota archaeon]
MLLLLFSQASLNFKVMSYQRQVAMPSPPESTTLHFDGDLALGQARSRGDIEGSGTARDPYLIQSKAVQGFESYGIKLQNTRAHVVIANCSIGGGPNDPLLKEAAIVLENASNVAVYKASIINVSYIGVIVSACSNFKIMQSRFQDVSNTGIWIQNSMNATIENNIFDSCGSDAAAIYLSNHLPSGTVICSNTIAGHGVMQHGIWIDHGIAAEITRNFISGSLQHGIELTDATIQCNITENVFHNNTVHIIVPADSSQTIGNQITRNIFFDTWIDAIVKVFHEGNEIGGNAYTDYFAARYPGLDATERRDGESLPLEYTWGMSGTIPCVDLAPVYLARAHVPGFDSDGDGLCDMDEVLVHRTHPSLLDSDFDGIADGVEVGGADPASALVPAGYVPGMITVVTNR